LGIFSSSAISASEAPQPEQVFVVIGLTSPHFGHLTIPGAKGSGSEGSGALQKGHATGVKFGETIFLPHSGHISGPVVTSGGLKHIFLFSF